MNRILKIICIAVLMIASTNVSAQTEQTKIILKNGTELIGVLKSLDPTSSVVLEICGVETTINMNDVQNIQKVQAAPAETNQATSASTLPKEKTVNICGKDVKFVLVDGSTFTYGYDGGGSRYVFTEPVHDITITPFYVSCEPVSRELVVAVYGHNPYEGYTLTCNHKDLAKTLKRDLYYGAPMPVPEKFEGIALFNAAHNFSEALLGQKYMENIEDFPYAKEFIEKIRNNTNEKIDMLDEGKWACIYNQNANGVEFPMYPELVYSINMNESKNPKKGLIMHKGRPAAFSIPGFRNGLMTVFNNRGLMPAHDFDKKNKEIKLYKWNVGYTAIGGRCVSYTIAPMHLVIEID